MTKPIARGVVYFGPKPLVIPEEFFKEVTKTGGWVFLGPNPSVDGKHYS